MKSYRHLSSNTKRKFLSDFSRETTHSSGLSAKSVVGQIKTQEQSNRYRLVQVCAVATSLCPGGLPSLTRCIVIFNSHGKVAMNFVFYFFKLFLHYELLGLQVVKVAPLIRLN